MYESCKDLRFTRIAAILVALVVVYSSVAVAGRLYPGYGGLKWGTDMHRVMTVFRNGTLGRIGGQMVYTQMDPDKAVRQRTFGFGSDGLEAVSITFRASHIKRVGIEAILNQLMANFGEGRADRSSAPHLFSYFWEDETSRITLAYSGESPDMTVLLFQHKK